MEEKLISLLFIGGNEDSFDFFSSQVAKDEDPFVRFSNDQALTLENGMSMMRQKLADEGKNYDLLVLDLDNSPLSGLDSYHQISEEFSKIPVVVLTSDPDPMRSADLVHAGVQEIIRTDFLMLPEAVCHSLCFAVNRLLRSGQTGSCSICAGG